MAPINLKWAKNDPKWAKNDSNGPKMAQMTQNDPIWPQMI